MIICVPLFQFDKRNAKSNKDLEITKGANLFYSARNKDQYFEFLADDFGWIEESQSHESKQTFME